MTRWINEHFTAKALKPSSQERYLRSCKPLVAFFGSMYLDEIKRSHVVNYVNKQLERGVKISTVKKDTAALSSIFTHSIECELIEINPVLPVNRKYLKIKQTPTVYLKKNEASRLLECCSDHIFTMVLLQLNTGMRQGEVLALRKSHIDLEAREINIPENKTGLHRVIPIMGELLLSHLLLQMNKAKGQFVFEHPKAKDIKQVPRWESYRTAWEWSLKRAKITGFRNHDLRHTFATWGRKGWHDWQDKPMQLDELQKWLGHTTMQMTQRYAKIGIAELHLLQKPLQEQGTLLKQKEEQ